MWDRNLGLNRKITKVISENLNDTNSEIYKEISDISSEYTQSNDIAKIIENGRDSITSFVNEDITYLGSGVIRNCPNLEEVILPNVLDVGSYNFENCPKLKRIILPRYWSTCKNGDGHDCPNLFNNINLSNLDIDILLLGISEYPSSSPMRLPHIKILVLPNLTFMGYSATLEADYVIIPNTVVSKLTSDIEGIMYVDDDYIDDYRVGNGSAWTWNYKYEAGELLPISQLPQEIREELELCQIQI